MKTTDVSKIQAYDGDNFDTLRAAIKADRACIMRCKRRSDGKFVTLICALNYHRVEDEYETVPLAVLVDGNPYEDYDPPTNGVDTDESPERN